MVDRKILFTVFFLNVGKEENRLCVKKSISGKKNAKYVHGGQKQGQFNGEKRSVVSRYSGRLVVALVQQLEHIKVIDKRCDEWLIVTKCKRWVLHYMASWAKCTHATNKMGKKVSIVDA